MMSVEARLVRTLGAERSRQVREIALALEGGDGNVVAPFANLPHVRSATPQHAVAEVKIAAADLRQAGGSRSDAVNAKVVNQAILASVKPNDAELQRASREVVDTLKGIGPRNEIEGALAAMLLATESLAMQSYHAACDCGVSNPLIRGELIGQGNRLVETHLALIEALDRRRGHGRQRVTIEHVHVHKGGQAIVGAVTARGRDNPHRDRDG
jgi:hypothetical protein